MAQLPDWRPLEDVIPLFDGTGAGRIVAVVASEGAVEAGWAPRAALDLARACSGAGDKVILVDAALHHPTLHAHAEVENVEGLSDATLFGVSVGRVAKPVDDGAFFLITAGTAVADASAVAGSRRWGRLLQGFRDAGVMLLVFLRDDDSGSAAFLGSASGIVVLAGRDEAAPAALRDLEGLVEAVTGPSAESPAPSKPEVGVEGQEVLTVPDRSGVPQRGRRRGGVRPPSDWTAGGPGAARRLLLLAVIAALLILLLAAVFGIVDIPGITPAQAGAAAPGAGGGLTGIR